MVKITLKWNKANVDVEADGSMSTVDFKSLVYSMTSVPVDRMKILGFPGGILKDDANFGDLLAKLKPNAKIQLIGTAEGGEIKAPEEKTVFIEDLTPEEKARILKEKKADILPVGLTNLENTCYMNSVIQVLKTVPELKLGLKPAGGDSNAMAGFTNRPSDSQFVNGLRDLLNQLDNTTETVTPYQFVTLLRNRFPQFGERAGNPPHYQQQDAEECLREMLSVVSNECKENDVNLADKLFGFKMKNTYKCVETEDEAPKIEEEYSRILMCHMGTTTEPVSHLHDGVKLSMKEHIEKNSPSLGRMAQYEKTAAMKTLPPYLFVQFARFGYKQANTIAGTEAAKVKHVRKCAFSANLDVYDYAGPELKEVLNIGRLKLREKKEQDLEEERKKIDAVGKEDSEIQAMEVDQTGGAPMKDFETGQYELIGVVSHKGRSADGGHYVGWVRSHKKDGKDYKDDQWLLFDDEAVFPYEWKQITGISLDLQGGRADTQIAYLCLYRRILCVMPDTPPKDFSDASKTDAEKK